MLNNIEIVPSHYTIKVSGNCTANDLTKAKNKFLKINSNIDPMLLEEATVHIVSGTLSLRA